MSNCQLDSAAIQVMDHQTGTLHDARAVRNYENGLYLVWAIRGDLTVRLLNGGGNVIVNGIFLGASQTPPASPSRRRLEGAPPFHRGPRFRGNGHRHPPYRRRAGRVPAVQGVRVVTPILNPTGPETLP